MEQQPPAPNPADLPTQPVQYVQHPVYVQQPVVSTNGLAIAALVLGILWLGWVGSVLAVIFGHVAISQIKQSGGVQGGRGMAIAGLVLGYIGVGVALAWFLFFPLLLGFGALL